MVDWLLTAIAGLVVRLAIGLLLLPASLALATPFILVRAPFRRGRLRSDYEAVIRFWSEMSPGNW